MCILLLFFKRVLGENVVCLYLILFREWSLLCLLFYLTVKNAFYVSVYRLGYLLKMHFLTIWTRIESFEVTFFFTGGNFLCAYACSPIFTTLKKCVSLTIPHFMYYCLMLQSFCDYKNHIKGTLLLVLISSLFLVLFVLK